MQDFILGFDMVLKKMMIKRNMVRNKEHGIPRVSYKGTQYIP